ncbi:hypothetical protein [Cupriavidus basilensis]|uniref:hypothetical protein n=1 Tax=Cupriavidus basilensis TaxID=68895 RepID=UPI0011863BC6|nr:hypothetical protein [Cupriavidus basilensis]
MTVHIKNLVAITSLTALFASHAMAGDDVLQINRQSRIEFSDPLQGWDKDTYGAGWKRARLIKPRGGIVELLPSETLTSIEGTIFSGAFYSSLSPSRKYVVLSTIRTGVLGDGPAMVGKNIYSRAYCPVISTESGCILNNNTGEICGGHWEGKKDLWRYGVDDRTDTMIKPTFFNAMGLWKAFSKSEKFSKSVELDFEPNITDFVVQNFGVSNLLACDPPSAKNRDLYILVARQLEVEGRGIDAKFLRKKSNIGANNNYGVDKVTAEKSWLYDGPEDQARTRMYLIKGDEIEIISTSSSGWVYVEYKGNNKKAIRRWMKESSIE